MPETGPETRPERDPGRERLRRALLQPTRGQVIVAVLLVLVGFAAVTQVRANQTDDAYAGMHQQDLIDVLNGLAGTSQRAQDQIQRLEKTRSQLQSDTNAREAALGQAKQQADTLAILAGTVPVHGPGVVITIREGSGPVEVGPFLDMVEALRTAGAESMSINGQVRVVAQTSFGSGAGVLEVDGRRLAAPYTIDAIGDPADLGSALTFPEGPRDELQQNDGAQLTYASKTDLTITTVRAVTPAADARPDQ